MNKHHFIRRRTIRHAQMGKAKKNKNCPKFIVGYCWHLFQSDILALCSEEEREYAEESFEVSQKWISDGQRDHLSLANVKYLFGGGEGERERLRSFITSRLFCKFLSLRALELVAGNKKLEKPLSYLICL